MDKANTVSPNVMTVDFPAERNDLLPIGKTVSVTFDIFSGNCLVFDLSKIMDY
jgi:hypothetical protein